MERIHTMKRYFRALEKVYFKPIMLALLFVSITGCFLYEMGLGNYLCFIPSIMYLADLVIFPIIYINKEGE